MKAISAALCKFKIWGGGCYIGIEMQWKVLCLYDEGGLKNNGVFNALLEYPWSNSRRISMAHRAH